MSGPNCQGGELSRFPSESSLVWPRGNGTYFLLFHENETWLFLKGVKHGSQNRKRHFIIGNRRFASICLLLFLLEGSDPLKLALTFEVKKSVEKNDRKNARSEQVDGLWKIETLSII